MAQYGQGALPPPEPDPPKSGDEHHSKKKDKKVGQLMVGDPVHFAVQDGAGKGPTRHGSVVLFVDGERALLASSPGVPNVKVIEVGGDKVGMSWVKTAYLGRGHKHCQTSLTLSLDAAWGLRSKILLTAGEVNEQIVLSGRGSATASNASDGSATSGAQSPWPQDEYGEQARPQDRELRAMVQEAMSSLQHQPPQHSNNPPPSGQMDQQQQHHHQHEQQQQYPQEQQQQQQQAMPPRQHVNHDYSGFSGDPNMARDLQNLIAQSFDEGIQAFRDEQKNMDRWVGLLQERVNKVTGHFLMSWGSRLESEMDRRLTKYSEEIRTTCASLQALQPVGYVGPPGAPQGLGKVAEPAPVSNSGIVVRENSRDRSSGKKQKHVATEQSVAKTSSNASDASMMGAATTDRGAFGFQRRTTKNDHTLVMIEKIKRDQARSNFF